MFQHHPVHAFSAVGSKYPFQTAKQKVLKTMAINLYFLQSKEKSNSLRHIYVPFRINYKIEAKSILEEIHPLLYQFHVDIFLQQFQT